MRAGISTILLSGLQPHRGSLRQDKEPTSQGSSQDQRGLDRCHSSSTLCDHCRRHPRLLSPCGILSCGSTTVKHAVVPEIVLLYKAHELTEKDEADFRRALPHLTSSRKAWLLGALDETTPEHPWARRLRG